MINMFYDLKFIPKISDRFKRLNIREYISLDKVI